MRAAPLGPSAELLWGHETCEGCAESKGKEGGGRDEGDEEEGGNAGRRLFKTRTQHHRMVGKKHQKITKHCDVISFDTVCNGGQSNIY